MKKLSVVTVMAIMLGNLASAALVDDFEGYQEGLVREVASPPWTAIGNTSFIEIQSENDNQFVTWGWTEGRRGGYRGIDAVDGTSTLFFQLYAANGHIDHAFGLSDLSAPTGNYSDYRVQMGAANRSGESDKFNLIGRAASGTEVLAALDRNTWYNVWAVIDHVANTYDVYYTSGTAGATSADQVGSGIAYRVGTSSDLVSFMVLANYAGELVRMDNIYLTDGAVLSNPVPEPATMLMLGLGGLLAVRRKR